MTGSLGAFIEGRIENKPFLDKVEVADTFWTRFRGLMMRENILPGEGLLIRRASSIHMCFMRFPIAAIFLDEGGRVVRCVESLRPWTGFAAARARDVLEVAEGTIARTGLSEGDRLLFLDTIPRRPV